MTGRKMQLALLVFLVTALTLAGCGVPKEEFAALQSQLASAQREFDDAKARLSSAQAEIDKLRTDAASQSAQAKSASDALQKKIAEVETKLTESNANAASFQKKSAELEARFNSILDTKFTQYYRFNHRSYNYDWNVTIPLRTYFYYKDLPRPAKIETMLTEPAADSILSVFNRNLREASIINDLRKSDVISLVAALVRLLPRNDREFTTAYDAYPRFPIETLLDQGGDSEDTAILAATLLLREGYDVVLLRFDQPKHVALGVSLPTAGGVSWEYQGRLYFYQETTVKGWELGEAPPPFRTARPTIIPVGQ